MHGIKVFDIYCAFYAIILGLKVYISQEDDYDNTALEFCNDLVKEAGLNSFIGRTFYTDNYYTSVALAKHIFNEYGWKIVGNIVPTYKKSRADHYITSLNFSNGARNGLQQGWYCEADIKLKTPEAGLIFEF